MPNQSGVWTLSQQFQARGQGLWPATPGAPTIGAATLVTTTSATVAFTAPACTGNPPGITGYQAISTPGCITATGASSPITVTGLTAGTAYTFRVRAQNASGYGGYSGASGSVQAKVPGAPTIGTATAGNASASVTFTAPACVGSPGGITGYTVTSSPGSVTGTGGSSPITVSGLTNCTAYTFKVKAQNAYGFSPCSSSSNSVTPKLPTCSTYTTAGTYTWVAPAGVTKVALLVKGPGGNGANGYWNYCSCCNFYYGGGGGGGGGGGSTYQNCRSVTPGSSYEVVVGSTGTASYFCASAGSKLVAYSGCSPSGSGGGGGGSGNNLYAVGGAGGNGVQVFYCGPQGQTYGGGGGGAAGYYGTSGYAFGGSSSPCSSVPGQAGQYGGASGGRGGGPGYPSSGQGGGGTGVYGEGTSGSPSGLGGSCGANASGANGGAPGGGGGGGSGSGASRGFGAVGAVRIVWAGGTRGTPSFPKTNVGP